MRRYFILFLIGVLASGFMACGDDDKGAIEFTEYILSVEVTNKLAGDVKIDHFVRQIFIEIVEDEDKSDVVIKVVPATGVRMVEPANTEAVYDLRETATIKLSASGKEVSYMVKAIDIEGPADPEGTYKGWKQTTAFGELPAGIAVYESPTTLCNKNAVAFIVVAETSQGKTFDVLGEATGLKTPTQFYESTKGIYPVVMNGGYFWSNTNLSLLCRDYELIAINNQVVSRKNASGSDADFYPTRGVFSRISGTNYQTDWVFTTVTPGTTYAYPAPAANRVGSDPLPVPSADFPEGAWEYKAQTAIGGGPVLVKNGVLVNTWEDELYDDASGIGATANNPRTAIGITPTGKLILFVCEGRNQTPETPGFTLEETASIMMDLGCTEVLNLDGGGSTCLLINGKETIKPSNTNHQQRAVASAVVVF